MHAAVAKKAGLTNCWTVSPYRRIARVALDPGAATAIQRTQVSPRRQPVRRVAAFPSSVRRFAGLVRNRSPISARRYCGRRIDDVSRRPGLTVCARGAVGYPVRVVKHGRRGDQAAR